MEGGSDLGQTFDTFTRHRVEGGGRGNGVRGFKFGKSSVGYGTCMLRMVRGVWLDRIECAF